MELQCARLSTMLQGPDGFFLQVLFQVRHLNVPRSALRQRQTGKDFFVPSHIGFCLRDQGDSL